MRHLLSAAVLVVCAGFARSDEPKIVGPDKLAPYKIARFSADGIAPTDGVLWRVQPLDPKGKRTDIDFGLGGKRNGREIEFVAPPGVYEVTLVIVKQPSTAGGALEIGETIRTITIGAAPKPPEPKPPAPEPKPKPPATVVDAELLAKYKTALESDSKSSAPMGGSKENAAKLAEVYLFAADKLVSTNEADWPKTVGALFETVGGVSVAQKVPRLPYFSNVRLVSSEALGSHDSTTILDAAKRAEFATKFKKVGLALKEAAK